METNVSLGNFSAQTDTMIDLENDKVSRDFGAHSVWTIVSLSIVYGLLSLTAFVGNTLVIWVICKYTMRFFMRLKGLLFPSR